MPNGASWIKQQRWIMTVPIKPLETKEFDLKAASDLPLPEDGACRIVDVAWYSKPDEDDPIQKPVPVSLVTKVYTDAEARIRFRNMKVALFNGSRKRNATVEIYLIEEVYQHDPPFPPIHL